MKKVWNIVVGLLLAVVALLTWWAYRSPIATPHEPGTAAPVAITPSRGPQIAPDSPAPTSSAPASPVPEASASGAVEAPVVLEPANAKPSSERPASIADGLPAEAGFVLGDALHPQCAMKAMTDEGFADAIDALSRDALAEAAAIEMRAAIAEAYREAFSLSGGGAEVTALACGRQVCLIEAQLPEDSTEDEIRGAMLDRLLREVAGAGVELQMPPTASRPRILRRVFSVSPAITQVARTSTSCE